MTTRFRVPAPRSASTLSRSADSSCSGSARSSGSAARSGSVRTWLLPTHATRSSASRWASSSVRATTTIGREDGRLARRTARCAGRADPGTRRTPGCGRWGRRASTSAATRRSPPRDEGMHPEWYRRSMPVRQTGPSGRRQAQPARGPRQRAPSPARAVLHARVAHPGSSTSSRVRRSSPPAPPRRRRRPADLLRGWASLPARGSAATRQRRRADSRARRGSSPRAGLGPSREADVVAAHVEVQRAPSPRAPSGASRRDELGQRLVEPVRSHEAERQERIRSSAILRPPVEEVASSSTGGAHVGHGVAATASSVSSIRSTCLVCHGGGQCAPLRSSSRSASTGPSDQPMSAA